MHPPVLPRWAGLSGRTAYSPRGHVLRRFRRLRRRLSPGQPEPCPHCQARPGVHRRGVGLRLLPERLPCPAPGTAALLWSGERSRGPFCTPEAPAACSGSLVLLGTRHRAWTLPSHSPGPGGGPSPACMRLRARSPSLWAWWPALLATAGPAAAEAAPSLRGSRASSPRSAAGLAPWQGLLPAQPSPLPGVRQRAPRPPTYTSSRLGRARRGHRTAPQGSAFSHAARQRRLHSVDASRNCPPCPRKVTPATSHSCSSSATASPSLLRPRLGLRGTGLRPPSSCFTRIISLPRGESTAGMRGKNVPTAVYRHSAVHSAVILYVATM